MGQSRTFNAFVSDARFGAGLTNVVTELQGRLEQAGIPIWGTQPASSLLDALAFERIATFLPIGHAAGVASNVVISMHR